MKKGFTLIEIMVSVAIFAVVVMIAIGSIISILDANRKAQSLNVIMNNLNFSFESMIRDIRTGSNYLVPTQNDWITFKDKDGNYFGYYATGGVITKEYVGTPPTNPLPTGAITSSEVTIDAMTFKVLGNLNTGDQLPSMVLLHIKGHAGKNKTQSNFNIQTLITQRVLDTLDL